MEKNNYLSDFTDYLRKKISPAISDTIAIHPGKTGKTAVQLMQEKDAKDFTSAIYTLTNEVSASKIIETEENDITLQGIAYVLVLEQSQSYQPIARRSTLYTILEHVITLLNNQRWQLAYTFPSSDITAMDLYGLSYDSDKLTGTEGWDPTIQAYAKDLYQTQQEEAFPKNLSLWCISWQQKLRIGNTD
jgi:hypothetical protein